MQQNEKMENVMQYCNICSSFELKTLKFIYSKVKMSEKIEGRRVEKRVDRIRKTAKRKRVRAGW